MAASVRTDLEVVFRTHTSAMHATPGTIFVTTPPLTAFVRERLFAGLATLAPAAGGLQLYQGSSGHLLVGHARMHFAPATLARDTMQLYSRILSVCAGHYLYRIWNYLPQINVETDGLEHYRAFCQGRSLAFEETYGARFDRHAPAASAVGCEGDSLDVIFVAGSAVPRHVENPEQIPAYRYPPDYGPRSPSFARATVVEVDKRQFVFVSGTAAIKGHASVAPGDLEGQIASTIDNLRLILGASGARDAWRRGSAWQRRFKVYLRRAADFAVAAHLLQTSLLHAGDEVVWLRSDICRSELDIEIEATLVRAV